MAGGDTDGRNGGGARTGRELASKRALVTAGASGIGRVIAQRMHEEGASVHVADIDAGALETLRDEMPQFSVTRADVADEEQVDRLFSDALRALGGLDVLVNCAGTTGPTAPVEEVAPEDWRRCVAVNLEGVYLCVRKAIPLLRKQGGGSIVNLSSTAGLHGFPNRTPYAAAKWAIIGFTKSVAMEAGGDGIRINAICPGSVAGARMDAVIRVHAGLAGMAEDEVRAQYAAGTSLKTFVTPQDIAEMAVFLCSARGARISGQALAVDGHTERM